MDGTLEPGERLNDDDLIAWLGVSRTPIREALAELARAGLIEMAPNRYTRVAAPTKDELLDAYRTLGVIYGGVVRLAVPRFTAAQRKKIVAVLDDVAARVDGEHMDDVAREGSDIYAMWVEACGNASLAQLCRPGDHRRPGVQAARARADRARAGRRGPSRDRQAPRGRARAGPDRGRAGDGGHPPPAHAQRGLTALRVRARPSADSLSVPRCAVMVSGEHRTRADDAPCTPRPRAAAPRAPEARGRDRPPRDRRRADDGPGPDGRLRRGGLHEPEQRRHEDRRDRSAVAGRPRRGRHGPEHPARR